MPFDLRLVVISLATFLVAGAAGASVVPWMMRKIAWPSPAVRAAMLFRLRLLPVVIATLATAQGIVSFIVFEPRSANEQFGLVLIGLALVSVTMMGIGWLRAIRASLATDRALQHWMAHAQPLAVDDVTMPVYAIDAAFPVVAVVGIRQPRLVIARSVLAACSPEELQAIFAHEQCHAVNRDNLRRAVVTALPDVLSVMPVGRALTALWHEATEAVADENTTRIGPSGRINLAAALVRVARLAPSGAPPIVLPASALYRGEDIAARVRRLLDAPPPVLDTRLSGWRRAMVASGVLASGVLALHAVHELVEAAVSFLP